MATLERLGIVSVMDAILGERPREELGDDVVTAMSNARIGYAMRNRETQPLGRSDYVARDDAIATLLDERTGPGHAGINVAVVHGVLRDVLTMGFLGGRENAYASTPGATAATRRQAIEQWAETYFPDDDPRTGRDVTVHLAEFGYFLHPAIRDPTRLPRRLVVGPSSTTYTADGEERGGMSKRASTTCHTADARRLGRGLMR